MLGSIPIMDSFKTNLASDQVKRQPIIVSITIAIDIVKFMRALLLLLLLLQWAGSMPDAQPCYLSKRLKNFFFNDVLSLRVLPMSTRTMLCMMLSVMFITVHS